MNISVAMAVYNGEKYLDKQIDSILAQLRKDDEMIISYNDSKDATWDIIQKYQAMDLRVKCYRCDKKGVIPNFENAILHTKGDIICLCDQDDIWNSNKCSRIEEVFENSDLMLVLHNCSYIDKNDKTLQGNLFSFRDVRIGIFKNLVKNCYQGCCMAFRREFLNYVLPIPDDVSMHDQWFGLCGELLSSVLLLDEMLIKYRRHGENASGRNVGFIKKIKGIFCIVRNLHVRKRTWRRMT